MAAMNKQQAKKYYSKKEPGRDTSYGARPGEITKGLKPGDRWYDPDTNTWQLKDGRAQPGGLGSYMDQLMENNNVQGQDRGAGREPQGSRGSSQAGSGSSQGTGSKGKGGSSGSEVNPPAGLQGDDLIKWLVRFAGMSATAAALYANRNKGNGRGASRPATDTAGEADKGGTGGREVATTGDEPEPKSKSTGLMDPDDIVSKVYGDVPAIEADPSTLTGARAAYDASHSPEYKAWLDAQQRGGAPVTPESGVPTVTDNAGGVTEPGGPQVTDPRMTPAADMTLGQQPAFPTRPEQASLPSPGAVDRSIRSTVESDPTYHDPEMQAHFKQQIDDLVGSGPFDPKVIYDPSINPGVDRLSPYDRNQLDLAVQNALEMRQNAQAGDIGRVPFMQEGGYEDLMTRLHRLGHL